MELEVQFHLFFEMRSTSRPGNFIPWKYTLVAIKLEAGWTPELVWGFGVEKHVLLLSELEPWTVQSVAQSL